MRKSDKRTLLALDAKQKDVSSIFLLKAVPAAPLCKTKKALVRSRLKRTGREGDGWATEGPTWRRPRVVCLLGTD